MTSFECTGWSENYFSACGDRIPGFDISPIQDNKIIYLNYSIYSAK